MWLCWIPRVHVHEKRCHNYIFPLRYLKLTLCFPSLYGRQNGSYLWHADSLCPFFLRPSLSFSIFLVCPESITPWLCLLSFFIIPWCPHALFMINVTFFHQLSRLIFNVWIIFMLEWIFFFFLILRHTLTFISLITPFLISVVTIKTHQNKTCCTPPIHSTLSLSPTSLSVFLTPPSSPSCYALLWGSSAAG